MSYITTINYSIKNTYQFIQNKSIHRLQNKSKKYNKSLETLINLNKLNTNQLLKSSLGDDGWYEHEAPWVDGFVEYDVKV